jgi:hypothetical protein
MRIALRILPRPLREGVGGRGWAESRTDQPLPATPSLKGRGRILPHAPLRSL